MNIAAHKKYNKQITNKLRPWIWSVAPTPQLKKTQNLKIQIIHLLK